MSRMVLASVICFLIMAPLATADIIYLKNGNVLEVDSAEIRGDFVIFTIFNGQMSINLLAVDRIEKTDTPARTSAISGSVGTPVSGAAPAGQQTADAQQGAFATETGGTEEEQNKEELVQFYIAQKKQVERENYFYRLQIDTLNSVIYAKAAIFSDTTPERTKIQEMQELIRQNQAKIQQMLRDARTQGLLPGDIRRIEDAKFEAPAGTETAQPQPDFDSSQPDYDNSIEEDIYLEEEEEEQGEEPSVPPPTR